MDNQIKVVMKNMVYAFVAQSASLILSISMMLLLPKFLGVDDFGYWQLFIFYVSYVAIFNFGLNEGVYLRFGGWEYNKLDHALIGSQWKLSIVIQFIMSVVIIAVSSFFVEDPNRRFVIIWAAIYFVIFNTNRFLCYIFQAVNQTNLYSIAIMIEKVLFILVMVVFMFGANVRYEIFIILYTVTLFIGLIFCMIKGRKIVGSKMLRLPVVLREMYANISVGIKLLLANQVGMFIIGIIRLIVDRIWGIAAFSKFSFALNISNFFLVFSTQITNVLFPALKQIGEKQLLKVYTTLRTALGLLLPAVFLCYIPIKFILVAWLPQYAESLQYLALILPMTVYDVKMQMLCNTYFKVLRKEKQFLVVNLSSLVLSTLLGLFGGYVLKSIYAIVIFSVIATAFRCISSEVYLSRVLKVPAVKGTIQELVLGAIFMICSWYLNDVQSLLIFLAVYIVYLVINNRDLRSVLKTGKEVLMKSRN